MASVGEAGVQHAQRVRDHWWWRPGWHRVRRFYTWHVTFEDADDVHRLVREYQSRLDVPGLDLVPLQWLHLTMQGVGFTDEVTEREADEVVRAAHGRCARLSPFTLTLGPARVDPEAIMLEAAPGEPVRQLRDSLRVAIADTWGPDSVPESAEGFTPHVSLAYINTEGSASPLIDAVESVGAQPAQITIRAADLIVLDRDARLYRWNRYATAALDADGTSMPAG